jgi:dolichyl-phosphate-mannose--protein O-mannosyl transferase
LLAVCAALLVMGVVLRVQRLGFPPGLSFDEHHFVENARNYLAGRPDWNDHPPLGKLLLAAGMLAVGDTARGWRVVPLLFGLANIALAYALAKRLFRSGWAGLIAATLFAADGFLLAYSRTALLDGILTSFALATALALARPRTWRSLLVAAALAGAAMSVKLSGASLGLPVLVAALTLPRPQRLRALLAMAALPAVYGLIFSIGLRLTGKPAGPAGVVAVTRGLVQHHLKLTDMLNPATSRWYTWFAPTNPITLRMDAVDEEHVRGMTTLGNLALWWGGELAVLGCTLGLGRRWWRRRRPPRGEAAEADTGSAGFLGEHGRAAGWLLLCWVSMLATWILTRRDSYIYHYLPSYGFALVLLAGWLAHLYQRRRLAALAALLLAAEVAVLYAPVWAQLPLTRAAWQARLFVPGWR